MELYFVTTNRNKFEEAKKLLDGINLKQLDISLDEIQELDSRKIIRHKLESATLKVDGAMIVEDTSLEISGMNGLPGPFIKWFLDSVGLDGIYSMSKIFGHKAVAVTTIGYQDKDKNVLFFEGRKEGIIVSAKGKKDFSWDPIFVPDGHEKTYAEMDMDEKNMISHRHIAVEKLKTHLNKIIT